MKSDKLQLFEEIISGLLRRSKFLEELCQSDLILKCAQFAGEGDYGFLWAIKNEIGPIIAYFMLQGKKDSINIKRWEIYAKTFASNYIKTIRNIKMIDTVIKNLNLEKYCTFVKIRPYPRNHSDVDLLTCTPNKLINAFKNLGFYVIAIADNNTTVKMSMKSFLPIEIHSRLSWEGLELIDSVDIINNATRKITPQFPEVGEILLPSYLDDFLITIAHKIFQEGTITVGDLIHLYYDITNDANCKKLKEGGFIKDLPWGFLAIKYCTMVEKLFLNRNNSSSFFPANFPIEAYQFLSFPYFKLIKKYGKNSIKWLVYNTLWTLLRKMRVLHPSYY